MLYLHWLVRLSTSTSSQFTKPRRSRTCPSLPLLCWSKLTLPSSIRVRDRLLAKWTETQAWHSQHKVKRVSYFSLEFLLGRSLDNALLNLELKENYSESVGQLGFKMEDLLDSERDAGLGNGGLGRLAACYLDSLSSESRFRSSVLIGFKSFLPISKLSEFLLGVMDCASWSLPPSSPLSLIDFPFPFATANTESSDKLSISPVLKSKSQTLGLTTRTRGKFLGSTLESKSSFTAMQREVAKMVKDLGPGSEDRTSLRFPMTCEPLFPLQHRVFLFLTSDSPSQADSRSRH